MGTLISETSNSHGPLNGEMSTNVEEQQVETRGLPCRMSSEQRFPLRGIADHLVVEVGGVEEQIRTSSSRAG